MNAAPVLYPASLPQGTGSVHASTVAAVPQPMVMDAPATANEVSPQDAKMANNAMVDVGLMAGDMAAQNGAHILAKQVPGVVTTLGVKSAEIAGNAIGTGASAVISGVGAVIHARRAREELLADFRDTVAIQLKKPREAVTNDDLYLAAEKFKENAVLRDELAKIDSAEMQTPVRSTLSTIAGFGTAAALGVATGGLAAIPAFIGGGFVADKMMNMVAGDTEYATAYSKVKELKEKQAAGGVSAMDLFDLHLALNKPLSEQVKARMGKEFPELDEKQKATVMRRDHPKLTDLCLYEASLINGGQLNLMQVRADGQLPSNVIATQGATLAPMRAANVNFPAANSNVAQGHAEKIAAERAAAALAPQHTQV